MEQLTAEVPPICHHRTDGIIDRAFMPSNFDSNKDISFLAKTWTSFPDPKRSQFLWMFLHHLNCESYKVPTEPNLDVLGVVEDAHEGKAFWSLWALASLSVSLSQAESYLSKLVGPRTCEQDIIEAWPGIFRWSAFFYTSRVQVSSRDQFTHTADSARYFMRGILRDVIAGSWSALSLIASVRKTMLATRGVGDIAARLWIFEDAPDILRVTSFGQGPPNGTLLLDLLSRDGGQEVLNDIMSAAGGDIGKIVNASISRLKKAIRSSKFATSATDGFTVFHLIDQLCRFPNPENLRTFLDRGIIPISIKLLLLLAASMNDGSYAAAESRRDCNLLVVLAFQFLSYALGNTKALPLVLQAINAGLLTAFIECSPVYDDLSHEDYEGLSATITNTIPRYLAYLCIAKALDKAFLKLERTAQFLSLRNTRAWEAFDALALLTARRFGINEGLRRTKKAITACSNPQCHKVDARNNFRKCAKCGLAFYCSKECQILHWKDLGHKQECNKVRADGEISAHDWEYIEGLKTCEAWCNLPRLKRLVTTEYSGVPLDALAVVIDYNVVPTSCQLARLSAWVQDHPERFPSAGKEGVPEDTKSSTYIIAIVPHDGESNPIFQVTHAPEDFWNMDDEPVDDKGGPEAGIDPTRDRIDHLLDKEAEARRELYYSI
ncbi:hypothetical protein BDN72DRAFT_841143 [Pluteus cervinus]|uniref:Uncharacterized protein n=1 Tax=Pluteus cervinus TaxID=181527 RepID=A0ACD3ATN3_9AGAR|nr:hypothetical protein BDN72DRAFT_841143 [Pluteus cervinus]